MKNFRPNLLLSMLAVASVAVFSQLPPGTQQAPVEIRGEPRHHPKFENEFVRVWDVTVLAGDATLWHIHRNDNVVVILGGANLRIETVGAAPTEVQWNFGDVRFGKATYVHRAMNVGTTPFHNLTIELLKAPIRSQAETKLKEPITRAPAFENERVRAYRLTLEPGQSTPMHTHQLSGLAISITAGEIEITTEGKIKPDRLALPPGDVRWRSGPVTHMIKNAGKTRFEAVDIELK